MNRVRAYAVILDRRAVAAVEFALVCFPFTLFLMAVFAVGMNFYFQQVLDFTTQKAAREVQLGVVPATYTQADFVNKVFCPLFSGLQACANLFIDLRPVVDYKSLVIPNVADAPGNSGTTGLTYCIGQPGQLMYLHVVYLAPSLNALFGLGASALVSNVAFANENPSGATVVSSNGC